jgi:hypothetical protein
MTNPVAVDRITTFSPKNPDGTYAEESIPAYREIRVWCQGCVQMHPFRIETYPEYAAQVKRNDGTEWPTWSWNGSLTSPTFSPSLLCYSTIHICEDQHDILSLRCDKDFDECGHQGHGYGWLLPDGTVRQYKTYEYDQIPEGTEQFTWGGPSPHPLEQAWGNCHTFLTDGVWDFLGDCGHSLRGKHPLEPIPDFCLPHGF